ncbi:MAG: PilZ domain-containing protein [Nitrospiraceae bacterium]|nr:PilZ domain-containing protein [Nitrospiraceae bacterium]
MGEARKHHRISCRCPVAFSSEEIEGEGVVYNLGLGGCAVETEVALGDEGYITLSITPAPGISPVQIELARVRWATRREFGVEFLTVPSKDERRLEDFVRSHGPTPAEH